MTPHGRKRRWADDGVTLVETVVATVATGAVVLVALSAYLAASRAVTRWQSTLALDSDAHLVTAVLQRDLSRSTRAEHAGPDSLVVTPRIGPARTYALRDSALYRDSVRVTDPRVRVAAFAVCRLEASPCPATPAVEAAVSRDSGAVRVDIELRLGTETRTRSVVHAWRTPSPWRSSDET